MAWVRLDDAHQDHPKIAPLRDRSYRLWVRSIAYSNRFGLDGVLTASQLRQIRVPIRAKLGHETELVRSGLWHKTDTGIVIHDVSEYQPKTQKSAELSQKRSAAGRKGAAARWGTDGKLPMAPDAPVPSRPVPSPNSSTLLKDWSLGQPIDHSSQWEQASADLGISIQPTRSERASAHRVITAGRIEPYEYENAIKKGAGKGANYFFAIIEGERRKALEESDRTSPKPTQQAKGRGWTETKLDKPEEAQK